MVARGCDGVKVGPLEADGKSVGMVVKEGKSLGCELGSNESDGEIDGRLVVDG